MCFIHGCKRNRNKSVYGPRERLKYDGRSLNRTAIIKNRRICTLLYCRKILQTTQDVQRPRAYINRHEDTYRYN